MFEYVGSIKNEECWAMPIGVGKLRILIRSSINSSTGLSASCGEDSIRLIIERKQGEKWVPLGKGPDAYTTRLKGWQNRLRDKIKYLYDLLIVVNQDFDDTDCVLISKKAHSKGKIFKHTSGGQFFWLTP